MRHGDTQAAIDPLYGLLEQSATRLCTLAFLITSDWNIAIEAVTCAFDAGWESDAFSKAPTVCTVRHLVTAAVAAIRPQLRDSLARSSAMTVNPEEWLGPAPEMAIRPPPASADLGQALLAIDAFPRVTLLLTIFEGFSIADAGRLLETNDSLVRQGLMIGLLALTRHLSCQTRKGTIWVCRN
jgi:hypothetical protein